MLYRYTSAAENITEYLVNIKIENNIKPIYIDDDNDLFIMILYADL